MYITDTDEVVALLRTKLSDYLQLKLGKDYNHNKRFRCFAHDDNDPSMHLNPKAHNEAVKCFSCGYYGDIFTVANTLDQLPLNGPEWLTYTLPKLCEDLGINYSPGELTADQKLRLATFKLAQNISDILSSQYSKSIDYLVERNWIQPFSSVGQIDPDFLTQKLIKDYGWDSAFIANSGLVKTRYSSCFGDDKITFAIKDHAKRTIGFICRNINYKDQNIPKYVNTQETSIYKKSQALLGIDVALREAKKSGLFIVEGPGDLMQLYRLGIKNAVAVCGTSFTEDHLLYLKSLGIKKIYLNFDWDQAGYAATQRVLSNILKVTSGMATYIVIPPSDEYNDVDEYLATRDDPADYFDLERMPAFEWQLNSFSDSDTPDTICAKMVPIIAAETSSVKREVLIRYLAQYTTVSASSIANDVNNILNNKFSERMDKIRAATESYARSAADDPDNVRSHMAMHEQALEIIDKEYRTNTIGINYQIDRFKTLQDIRQESTDDQIATGFKMDYFSDFADNMNGGMSWSSGALMYVGGRANSGKTATCLMIGTDIAMSDENALVIIHSTDDSYEQIEPRIKTNIYRMSNYPGPKLTIGMVVQPNVNLPKTEEYQKAFTVANKIFMELIEQERLVIIDSEDGANLSTLERNLKYYRNKYPKRKILMVCDNTHNYIDFMNLEQTSRMTMISNQQKNLTVKYHACMIATAEYRKNMPMDHSKMRLPVDDDLADARALMYRPNVIWHVYNDMHDRKEHAEFFWKDDEGNMRPRLLLHFTKNKISGFKEKLVLDLDPATVSLKPVSQNSALEAAEQYHDLKQAGYVMSDGRQVKYLDANEYDEG